MKQNSKVFNRHGIITLKNVGKINPESIEDFIAHDGYIAFEKALFDMNEDEVIDEVKDSGLRGRGGAGFPTGLKWSFTAPLKVKDKFIICNADEGEPGTCKDRLIMEGNPHKLIEGILIAGYAVRANKGYIYIRGEYYLSIERLGKAIKDAYKHGYLGQKILETNFSFDLEIKVGGGAYVCGEETSLIESLEGKRGLPRFKPPFPGIAGLWQKPSVVNNVETLCNIPDIISKGGEWFRSFGTKKSTGTKIFMILGNVKNPGIIELPQGVTLRELIYEHGGGMEDDKELKCTLVGGAAGCFVGPDLLDIPMTIESLSEHGAALGSGSILVLKEGTNLIALMKNLMHFFKHESCGQCTPCRYGTEKLYRLICKISDDIARNKPDVNDLNEMLETAKMMQKTSLCALGQSPLMPLESAMKYCVIDEFKKRVIK